MLISGFRFVSLTVRLRVILKSNGFEIAVYWTFSGLTCTGERFG